MPWCRIERALVLLPFRRKRSAISTVPALRRCLTVSEVPALDSSWHHRLLPSLARIDGFVDAFAVNQPRRAQYGTGGVCVQRQSQIAYLPHKA